MHTYIHPDTSRMRGFHLPPERVAKIKRLGRDPMIYEKVKQAVFPPWMNDYPSVCVCGCVLYIFCGCVGG